MEPPKLFISYSWSNPEHEQWVLDLATRLRESGVDTILDKWDLREGGDKVAFMEQMVNNPEIKKVAIICDKAYADKANNRAGGVGTETQIISQEVYEKQDQNKFVAIIREKNEKDEPYLPTYYKSRIYIDLCDEDYYEDNFEKLLRWIFDKPLYIKPELGKKPSFIEDGEHISLGTTGNYRRCLDAIKNNKQNALGSFEDYINTFIENLERFRLSKPSGEFDDAVVNSIVEFIPFRNEYIELIKTICQYSPTSEFCEKIHYFLEQLIPFMDCPNIITSYREWDFDNYRFTIHELYLYTLAITIKYNKFDMACYFMELYYYTTAFLSPSRNPSVPYTIFRRHMESLRLRNERLQLKKPSLRYDILKERCKGFGIEFLHLMQADFVAFMRAEIILADQFTKWFPDTLLYVGHHEKPFEIFARATSKKYFDKIKCLLAIDSKSDLEPILRSYSSGKRQLPKWEFESFSPGYLLNYQKLATEP
jgi:hypothetical protein